MVYLIEDGADLVLSCYIQPGSSRDAIAGIHGGRLKVQINSPPVDGKANERLVKFMAKTLGVSKSQVEILKGLSSRQKTLRIKNLQALPADFPRSN